MGEVLDRILSIEGFADKENWVNIVEVLNEKLI
jgi:hypothetical protein